jgi:hypothetical protein
VHYHNKRRRNWDYWSTPRADPAKQPAAARRDGLAYLKFWLDFGLSVRAATAAATAGCQSLDELRGVGWRYLQHQENCGTRTLQELSELVGGWPDAPLKRGEWIRRVSDDTLIEEVQRRGLAIESDAA